MQEAEGFIPDCEIEGKACLVPPLCADGSRIMEIYNILCVLNGLVDAGTIFTFYEVQKEDLEILATIKNEFNKATPKS